MRNRKLQETMEAKCGYDLSPTLYEIRPGYQFNENCRVTVLQAAYTGPAAPYARNFSPTAPEGSPTSTK